MAPAVDRFDDVELIAEVARRRPAALEEVYRRHSAAVLGVARRVLAATPPAEEVVQEVFLRLWRRPDRYDPARGTLRTYLLVDANARAIEHARSETARKAREDRSARLDVPKAGDDVEADAWDLVVADHLRDALDALTPGEREAIELAYYCGYTYRDVARLVGAPEGTVKSRIRTGLLRLRERLLAVETEVELWSRS
jgi:RNA polymerase sigma-70 factor (ECF subfamily)